MGAREQARQAAVDDLANTLRYGGATGPEHAADAASDVWEPLLRDIVDASKRHPFTGALDRAIARAEAALRTSD